MPKHNRHSLVSCKWIVASFAGGTSGEGSGSALYVADPMGNQSVRIHGRRMMFSARGLMCAMVASVLLLGLGLAQTSFAQTTTPLALSNNYMVTGDYVVGGWNKTGSTTMNGIAMSTGTIVIPDAKAYATGTATADKQVPAGADIVAAYVYWSAVENSSAPGSGSQGYFQGYPITGDSLGNPNAPVSWSSGGCVGPSNGSKTMRVYRAEVSAYFPLGPDGNPNPNGSFSLSLPNTGKASQPGLLW